jgi:hypothetical protein
MDYSARDRAVNEEAVMRVLVVTIVMVAMIFSYVLQALAKDATLNVQSRDGQMVLTIPDPANEASNGLIPFSRFMNYMSLAGFVRWHVWVTEQRWLVTKEQGVIQVTLIPDTR